MNIIEKHINLNVSQPNDFELVCAMQGDNDTLKIIAHLYDTNVPYIIDSTVNHIMLQGVAPSGASILKDITEQTASTASFLLSDNMLAADGDLELSIIMADNITKQVIRTFPFKIRVIHAPIGEIQESEFESIIKYALKASEHANEAATYNILSQSYAVGGTNTRENEDNDNAKTYMENAKTSAENASLYEQNAKTNQELAQESETNAENSAIEALNSSIDAAQKADEASTSANNAKQSEINAKTSSDDAKVNETNAKSSADTATESAKLSQSYAVGGTDTRENENIDNSKYYYEQSKSISESFSGALRPMGTISFSSLPSIDSASDGDMYNISDQFTTTADFKEGSGNIIPAGSNIYKTADGKWDILAGTPVSGIKGNAESEYRTGNVNITPADIGLDKVDNTADANKNVATAIKATQDGNGKIITDTYMPLSGGTFTGNVHFGDKVEIWSDSEGGNIRLCSPTSNDTYYEMDILNGNLRIYKMAEGTYNNPFSLTNDTLTVEKMLNAGGKAFLYTTEADGGKVQIHSPSTYGRTWVMDAYDGNVRFYTYIDGTVYTPCKIRYNSIDVIDLEINKVGTTSQSVTIGGKGAKSNSRPILRITQFTNGLQIMPNENTAQVTLGHQSFPFQFIVANDIYNSSGIMTSSDRNKKKDFSEITQEFADSIIDGFKPTSFKYKDGTSGRTHYALIAQDVEDLLKELGIDTKDFAPLIKVYPDKEVIVGEDVSGKPIIELQKDYNAEPEYFLRYEGLSGLIIKYIQGLKAENSKLREDFNALENRMEALENKLS